MKLSLWPPGLIEKSKCLVLVLVQFYNISIRRNLDREIRNQQEAEYAETLRRDQEREERLREQEEQERREQEERETLRREELEKKDKIVRMKIEFASEIPEEPEPEVENVVRVCIKLPGGQRLDRR